MTSRLSLAQVLKDAEVFVDGDWVESKDQDPDGDVRLIQLADIGDGYFIDKSSRYLTKEKAKLLKCTFLKEGDILIARMPDPLGRACIFPKMEQECVTVVDVCIIRPNTKTTDSRWLMHCINSEITRNQINSYISGATRQRISRGNLAKIEIDFPPLEEQCRIASILDKADAIRQKRQQAIAKLDELLQATFIDMFGDPIKNEKGWPKFKLENLASNTKYSIKAGPFGSALKKEDYVANGYKIYGQEQVIRDDFEYGDYYISEEKYESLKNCAITEGDVLISLVGTFGKISVVPKNFEEGIINPRLMKITFDTNKISPYFAKYLLTTKQMLAVITSFSHGGTMGIVNVGIMKNIELILPPLDLQEKFIKIMLSVFALKEKNQQAIDSNLFESLQQKSI